MAKTKGVDWDKVDWSKSNGDLSDEYNVGISSVRSARKRRGLKSPRKGKMRKSSLWVFSENAKGNGRPSKSIDYEYKQCSKGRRGGKGSGAWREAVCAISGPECGICGYYKPPVSNHCHHIVPLSEGGKNVARNGIVICSRCHDEIHAGLLNIPKECIRYVEDFSMIKIKEVVQ